MSGDSGQLPMPIDRTALERVLERAAELQGQSGESPAPSDTLSEEQVIELGKEVGLSAQHLRQALAEERTRIGAPIPESTVLARYLGPSRISASRTVQGNPRSILEAIDAWMQKEECLQVKRQFADRIVWDASRGLLSAFKRGLDMRGRGFILTRAVEVGATAVPLDERSCIVRLDADFSGYRSDVTRDGMISTGFGGFATVAALAMNVLLPVALIPVIGGAAIGLAQARSRQRQTLERGQLALEQILDRLERGELGRGTGLRGLLTMLALVPLIAAGCADAGGSGAGAPGDAAAARQVERRPFRDVGCEITPGTQLDGNGLGAIRIGVRLPDLREGCRVVRDSIERVEGMNERILAIDAGYDTVTAVVVGNRIWRVHVHGPGFRTDDGFGVGTSATELRESEGSRFLAGEGLAFVTLDRHCGLSFRLAGVPADVVTRGEWPVVDDLGSATVDQVLIVGCSPDPPESG